jgi:hypothetical protein
MIEQRRIVAMPAYHQIEVYIDLAPECRPVWERLIALGTDRSWMPPIIVHWLRDQREAANSGADDGRLVQPTAHSPRFNLVLGDRPVSVWWLLSGWVSPDVSAAWLTWQLMVDYESVHAGPDGYRPGVLTDIWAIMAEISAQLPDAVIFWTDEVQDGVAWNAIAHADRTACWQFDLAIIPAACGVLYEPPHPAFAQHGAGSAHWVAARYLGQPPWAILTGKN